MESEGENHSSPSDLGCGEDTQEKCIPEAASREGRRIERRSRDILLNHVRLPLTSGLWTCTLHKHTHTRAHSLAHTPAAQPALLLLSEVKDSP